MLPGKRDEAVFSAFVRMPDVGAKMDSAAAEFALQKFSTDALPERDRIPILREVFGRKMVRIEIEPAPGQPIHIAMAMRQLPGLRLHVSSTSPARFSRTREHVSAGSDEFAFVVNLRGECHATQRGTSVSLAAGDAILISHSEPAAMAHMGSEVAVLIISRSVLAPLVTDLDETAMRIVPGSAEALRHLVHYFRLLQNDLAFATPELRQLVVIHVCDLVALALGATRDEMVLATGRGLRAARMRSIKSDILANLSDGDLTETAVAERQGVTPRYIRMLFESEGTSFSAYLLGERLKRAHRTLSNLCSAERSISAIAFDAGFGDLSYFNRTFRRRFGTSPSEVRAAAISKREEASDE